MEQTSRVFSPIHQVSTPEGTSGKGAEVNAVFILAFLCSSPADLETTWQFPPAIPNTTLLGNYVRWILDVFRRWLTDVLWLLLSYNNESRDRMEALMLVSFLRPAQVVTGHCYVFMTTCFSAPSDSHSTHRKNNYRVARQYCSKILSHENLNEWA